MSNKFIYDCSKCTNKCDGISKGNYKFENDLKFSQRFENGLVKKINDKGYAAKITDKEGYPDVEVYINKKLHCYIEVKAQRRTFMSVKKILPEGNLTPSETIALNLSDLERYIRLNKSETVPMYIMWALESRKCILKERPTFCYFQDVNVLEQIKNTYGDKRKFRRKSGKGDVINGEHKGVVVNYHFSLNELIPFSLDKIL